MRRLVLVVLVFVLPALAGPPSIWSGLAPGPFAVGLREAGEGVARAVLWYPAAGGGEPLALRDLLPGGGRELADLLVKTGVPDADAQAYLAAPLHARRGAKPVDGAFPLVVVAPGNGESPGDQAVLAEYLASHGFVVATPAAPAVLEMKGEDDVGPVAESQSRLLASVAETAGISAANGVAAVGHSFGARSALLWACREPRVRAVVSLDGGIGSANGAASFRASPSLAAARATPPVLHLYETADEFMRPDVAALRALAKGPVTAELLSGLHHVHFTTLGFGAAAIPSIARATGAGAGAAGSVRRLAERTREFLDQRAPASGARAAPTRRATESR